MSESAMLVAKILIQKKLASQKAVEQALQFHKKLRQQGKNVAFEKVVNMKLGIPLEVVEEEISHIKLVNLASKYIENAIINDGPLSSHGVDLAALVRGRIEVSIINCEHYKIFPLVETNGRLMVRDRSEVKNYLKGKINVQITTPQGWEISDNLPFTFSLINGRLGLGQDWMITIGRGIYQVIRNIKLNKEMVPR